MKIYTGTGDAGETGLYGGQRVGKDDVRVEAYGAVDEANAALGVAAAHLRDGEILALVTQLQSELFTVGADLATPLARDTQAGKSIVPRIEARHSVALEQIIDRFEAELEPLRSFILPGGSPGAAFLHLARTITRRSERQTVVLWHTAPEEMNLEVLRYLNRLADLLFVLARAANHREGIADVPWTRPADPGERS
ncbi:MAG: cob(I)yrinic acid a,c-diamide adenosyltransferase [Cytophagales bacterium]|nr:cob(I)yrinic acid a,c-diamide adenosyltransferase [Armatimonadota bacterium]